MSSYSKWSLNLKSLSLVSGRSLTYLMVNHSKYKPVSTDRNVHAQPQHPVNKLVVNALFDQAASVSNWSEPC